ncbi:MAG: hypothetical protein K6D97_08420 [Clostridia bacterium]|nr:hypothetical protein [Clostridia bacterium]
MKKLSNEYLNSFKKIMINLIVILMLILSFVFYKAIAADNEYLVIDAPESNSIENNVFIDFENSKENLTYETGERRTIYNFL